MSPFRADDICLHRKLTALHAVPGVPTAVGAVRRVDRDEDTYHSALWVFPLDGGAPRALTAGAHDDTAPRLSPSGDRVAFVSDRSDGKPTLYLADLATGHTRPCGAWEGTVGSPRWLPDGRHLLVTVTVAVDPDRRGQRAPGATPARPGVVELAWRLPYKADGVGYILSREVHVFRVDVSTGESTRLTDGPFDVMGVDPSPDGRRIAFVRTREGRFAHRTDLWLADADGQGARQATDHLATVMQPAWSPDGRWIAFAGAEREGDGRSRLWLHDAGNAFTRPLGDAGVEVAAVDDAVQWSADGREVLFVRAHRGCHEVAAIGVDGSDLRTLLPGDRQFGAMACDGRHVAVSVEHPSRPCEVVVRALDGGEERRSGALNPWWDDRTPIEATRRTFTVPDGRGGTETIEGWLIHAAGAPAPRPLLNDVHGGPASHALLDFDTNVFWQMLCARGWSVLALNAVGSSSYGDEFCDRLAGHWGEMDLPQHLAAVKQLQDEGVADDRVALCGKSYGGYLSAWGVGHTDVFRAAIVMAPVGNIETHYGTSDGGYYADPLYLGTPPHFDRRLARALSPLQHIARATTPTLFLQGKEDERCPKCQSEEMFVALCRAGETPTELVLYPDEGHGFLGEGGPACRMDAAERIVAWLTRHVEGASERPHGEGAPA